MSKDEKVCIDQYTVSATIAATQKFVGVHRQQPIDTLEQRPEPTALRQAVIDWQSEEQAHRNEANAAFTDPPHDMLMPWRAAIWSGLVVAVTLARKL